LARSEAQIRMLASFRGLKIAKIKKSSQANQPFVDKNDFLWRGDIAKILQLWVCLDKCVWYKIIAAWWGQQSGSDHNSTTTGLQEDTRHQSNYIEEKTRNHLISSDHLKMLMERSDLQLLDIRRFCVNSRTLVTQRPTRPKSANFQNFKLTIE
jgi:hypothetical protein